ncbi:hypothetical protein [Planomonospora sp. ID67723]|nr:hypothetical protein [Planomonospora sp. ID67723]
MNKVLPETAHDVELQVESYEWMKFHFPDLYRTVTEMIEARDGVL